MISRDCQVTISQCPFSHVVVDHFLEKNFYDDLVSSFNEILNLGLCDHIDLQKFCIPKSGNVYLTNDPAAYMYSISHQAQGTIGQFYSLEFKQFIKSILNFDVGRYVAGALHHHKENSPSSPPHSDYNLCNFKSDREIDSQIIPFSGGTIYQGKYDKSIDIVHCCRSVGMVFYLANDTWGSGRGGETGLYDKNKNLVKRIEPLSNRLLVFKVTPWSYHSYLENGHFKRNSIAIWYHRPLEEVLSEYRDKPYGLPLSIYNDMLKL